ncbi:hypothetical protein F5887DRAFT_1076950 [Amanita rubescens]|nr:hypothetical protein F5887DRAFT_1078112 [Amanita rubescens]KAF8340828.1 hypothetical protein F5887DRAFT_1076950 [Amanita rubescens]
MPVSRTTIRASRNAPYGQRPALLGTLVANNGQSESRDDIIAALSQEAMRVAGACPNRREDCASNGHSLLDPFLCLGLTTPANFGRWTQLCITCSGYNRTRFLSDELPSHLWFNERVQMLQNRAEELKSKNRPSIAVHPTTAGPSDSSPAFPSSSPPSFPILSLPPVMTTPPTTHPVLSPPLPSSPIMSPLSSPYLAASLAFSPLFTPPSLAGVPLSSPLLSLPSPLTSPPTTYSVISPVITPAGELLDNEKPVFIIFWNQASPNLRNEDGVQPIITTAFPRRNGLLQLEDFKMQLGAFNVEQMNSLEVDCGGIWDSLPWGTSIIVHHPREIFCFRYEGVRNTPFWNEYRQFLQ